MTRQRATVIEYERRHPQTRVEVPEQLEPVCAIDHVHLATHVIGAEVREQQPDLVAVA